MQCPACKGTLSARDPYTDETCCSGCGLILDESLDLSLPPEEIKNPHHEPTLLTMPWTGFSSGFVSEVTKYGSKTHGYESDYDKTERSFADAHYAFTNICGNLRVDYTTRIRIAMLFRKCARNGLTKGRERFALIIAMSETVCEEIGIARDFDYFIDYFGADGASVSAYKKSIGKMLEKEALPRRVWGYINQALCAAKANEKAFETAKTMLTGFTKVNAKSTGRKNPKTVAGAIAYKAMKKAHVKVKQKDVAAILGTSERGLRR